MNLKLAKKLRKVCKERYGEAWKEAYKFIKHETKKRQKQGA